MIKIKKQSGFSLIELMGVIGILALITTIVLVNFNRMRSQARDANRLHDVREIQAALELYYSRNQSYPTVINPGENFSSGGKNYLEPTPTNPTPRRDGNCGDNEYTYSALADNSDYTINFCLGNKNVDASRGANLISKNGLNALKGLVGWWKFEEGDGGVIVDTTGNKNNCHIVTESYDPTIFSWEDIGVCKTGFCGRFFGTKNSYLKCGKDNIVDDDFRSNDFIVTSGSISLWFNYKADIYVEGDHNILQIRSEDGSSFINLKLSETGSANLNIYSENVEKANISTQPITVERWYYLVATWDSSEANIYLKGLNTDENVSSVGDKTISLPIDQTKLLIGSNNWEGYLDDIRLYNRALSKAEIQATYDSLK